MPNSDLANLNLILKVLPIIRKQKKVPITCPTCGHNMGRSRCKAEGLDTVGNPTWRVRCAKCRTHYTVTVRFPKPNTSTQTP